MTYRSILTLLDNEPECDLRIRTALALGTITRSHLVGVAPSRAFEQVPESAGRESPAAQARLAFAARAALKFDVACTRAGIGSFDSLVEDLDPLEALARHVHASDLAILTQPDSLVEARRPHSFIEEAVLASARPLLVLPRSDAWSACGRAILVAWDGSREAMRAIVDALPMLRLAHDVHLVGWHRDSPAERDRLSSRLASAWSWLKRHDVSALVHLETCEADVATSMLMRAADLGCDMIVMGAYGPSRLGEHGAVSVSRRVLAAATVPVMLSH